MHIPTSFTSAMWSAYPCQWMYAVKYLSWTLSSTQVFTVYSFPSKLRGPNMQIVFPLNYWKQLPWILDLIFNLVLCDELGWQEWEEKYFCEENSHLVPYHHLYNVSVYGFWYWGLLPTSYFPVTQPSTACWIRLSKSHTILIYFSIVGKLKWKGVE